MTDEQIADIRESIPQNLWYYHEGALITYRVENLADLLAHIDTQAARLAQYEKTARGCGHCWPLYKSLAALEPSQ